MFKPVKISLRDFNKLFNFQNENKDWFCENMCNFRIQVEVVFLPLQNFDINYSIIYYHSKTNLLKLNDMFLDEEIKKIILSLS